MTDITLPDHAPHPIPSFKGKVIDWPSAMPDCDMCPVHGEPPAKAPYDAPTLAGPWANLCVMDMVAYGRNSPAAFYRSRPQDRHPSRAESQN